MKHLNFYFFGDIGEFDEYNPAKVCNKDNVPEVLYLIASQDKYTLSKDLICSKLSLESRILDDIIDGLKKVQAIHEKDGFYRLTFPAILENDINDIDTYSKEVGRLIGEKIIDMSDTIYKMVEPFHCSGYCSKERILYHLICDKIFDGTAFDYFSSKNFFSDSKLQPGNRDYIIVAYEDSPQLNEYSNNLLCSSNNFRGEGFVFNSFGDSSGDRLDMYRYFRKIQVGVHNSTPFEALNVEYNRILDLANKELASSFAELVGTVVHNKIHIDELNDIQKMHFGFLKEMNYVDLDSNGYLKQSIPVFFEDEINSIFMNLSDMILDEICPLVSDAISSFEINVSNITPVRHDVDIKETANELWHQIFGAANEYLANVNFVANPPHIPGEGRYLRSMVIKNNN